MATVTVGDVAVVSSPRATQNLALMPIVEDERPLELLLESETIVRV
jgi:hypothetical protein